MPSQTVAQCAASSAAVATAFVAPAAAAAAKPLAAAAAVRACVSHARAEMGQAHRDKGTDLQQQQQQPLQAPPAHRRRRAVAALGPLRRAGGGRHTTSRRAGLLSRLVPPAWLGRRDDTKRLGASVGPGSDGGGGGGGHFHDDNDGTGAGSGARAFRCVAAISGSVLGLGMPREKTRILMLISDTGGGHRASAQALKAAFEELYPGAIDARIVDFWTEIAGRPFHKFPEGYSFLAKNPPLWRCAWNYGRFPLTRRITEEFSNFVGNRNFRNAINEFRPHLVVSVHPLTQFIPLRVLKSLPRKIPFVTVCTDLGGAHPTWFHPDADLCFVPTDQVRKIALRCGLRSTQLRQYGLPVRPDFWHEGRARADVRADLGLLIDVPTALVVGGGDGVGGVDRITRALADRLVALRPTARLEDQTSSALSLTDPDRPAVQLVIVCGKNKRLRDELASVNWPVPVHVHGFVTNMSEWMAASDLIVSKAGPGTIAEALIRGLPIVLSGFLPGQEAPNVRFVTDAGVGAFSRDPETIAEIVAEWLACPDALEARARRARSLGRPNATYEIVREIAALSPSLVAEQAFAGPVMERNM
jgi:1,2-diacylglycerol 3-beta-galactosyltransferase